METCGNWERLEDYKAETGEKGFFHVNEDISLQPLQFHMHIAVGFVHSPLILVLLLTVGVSSHLLLELELPPLVGVNIDPVVGYPFGSFSDQAASMQGVFI